MNTFEKYAKYVNTSSMASPLHVDIDHAKNATYFTKDGKQYIDCFSGVSVTNAGHCNDAIVNAAKAQMDKLVHCCSYLYPVDVVGDLAEKLAQITPGELQMSFFGNSGAEAIEGAMRLAKKFTKKTEMIALTHSFHGRTLGTLSITGNSGRKRNGGPFASGVAFNPAPYTYRSLIKGMDPESYANFCADYLEEVIKFHTSQNVAFFIAEPILGEGGIIVPPFNFYKRIKEVLDHYNILFIVDEVQTGFGRTGKMFGIEHYGVIPDIMIMAKGIANGFPLSCFIATEKIAKSFEKGDHFSTFGGNPVACAAALACIDFMEKENIPAESARKGKILKERLEKIAQTNPLIGEVRGLGLMIGVELVKDKDKTPAKDEAEKIKKTMFDQEVLVGIGGYYGNVIRFQPPLTITDSDLERVADIFEKALNQKT